MSNGAGSAARAAAGRIREWIFQELVSMAPCAGVEWSSETFFQLFRPVAGLLEKIGDLAAAGRVDPWLNVRVAESDPEVPAFRRILRLGVFPIAGNPIHWGHLSCALLSIDRLRLDKVVLVVAGADARKPDMMPEAFRHEMARSYLPSYAPFFSYSPIARNTSQEGEASLFRILRLNSRQRIHAFYLAGSDHCRHHDPATGHPDTIEKLERFIAERLFGYDPRAHRVSAVFFRRGPEWCVPHTRLPVVRLPGPPINTSSTLIRRALISGRRGSALFALPYTIFRYLSDAGPSARRRIPSFSETVLPVE